MATVVLQYAGAALGTLVGGPVGGIIGRAIGGIAGNLIDQRLFGQTQRREGPRLNDLRVMASEEGAPIPAIWGRMRVAGQVIWSTNLEEEVSTDTQSASGKGGPKSKITTYSYFGNFAVGLCEGEITGLGRVWADGKVIDIDAYTTRLYLGGEGQGPDSLITTIEGQAPAYRGLAYIVFERLPLERFGNRLPQLSFEVSRRGNTLADTIKAVNIIPGATEFGYDTTIVTRDGAAGETISDNAHASATRSNWDVSMDQLQATCPNLEAASLVVAWFGNDLRCGNCTVTPRVESAGRVTTGATWGVAGLTRATALTVSQFGGGPAYGGTPSDDGVVRAIQDLQGRGIAVTFYPFIMMDVAPGNVLPDPYGGAAQQAYPWRGRITASIAPGRPGTPDKTATATTQVNAFFGTATAAHFSVAGTTVTYTGPAEWSYRRMILHYAALCAAAGGVDTFLIGSEMRGLTTLRSSASAYPAVTALRNLAAQVRILLPTAKISYAADWSEYFGHQPGDGSNDVYFHLDALWADANINFIGIDNYMPLADWRDGENHVDAQAGVAGPYDQNYLRGNIAAGEGYDWFYASQANRDVQLRTPITDGTYGKPWVFRYKDLVNWWSSQHRHRPAGVEGTLSAWVPQSKPIVFTEAGCPAIDKGANQPNVFYDAKSSESAVPHYSGGQRDDVMQLAYLQAMQGYWSEAGAHNPISSVYGQSMLAANRIAWWAWDARPFPAFPARSDIWSDAENYARGHWLNGRLGAVSLANLLVEIAGRHGLDAVDATAVHGLVDGFVIDRPMSGRAALEGLLAAFALDAVESEGVLHFRHRDGNAVATLSRDDVVETGNDQVTLRETRVQETDLPKALRIAYVDSSHDYRAAAVQQSRFATASSREVVVQLPAAVSQSLAQQRADVAMAEKWAGRSTAKFALPPSWLNLEPGDVVTVDAKPYRLTDVTDAEARGVEAVLHDASVYAAPALVDRLPKVETVNLFGSADVVLMDLAVSTTTQPAALWAAAQAKPWPGTLNVLLQGPSGYAFNTALRAQATMGETLNALPTGRLGRFDFQHSLTVRMHHGALSSASREDVLAGANVMAVGTAATGYEIIQFTTATLQSPGTYVLQGLLRAQAGSFAEMLPTRATGQTCVLLNGAVLPLPTSVADAARDSQWKVGPASLDYGHPAYRTIQSGPSLKGIRPLRPSQLRLARNATGVMLTWIRQTRVGGDGWELEDVPLGEDREAYVLRVMSGSTIVRSWTTTQSQQFYSTADMISDFGAAPSSLNLAVAQTSATTGVGTFLERILNV